MNVKFIHYSVCLYFLFCTSIGGAFHSFTDADPSEFYEEGDKVCRDVEETRERTLSMTPRFTATQTITTRLRSAPTQSQSKHVTQCIRKKCDISFRPRMKKVRVRICPGEKDSVNLSTEESGGYRNNVVIDVRPNGSIASKTSPCIGGKRKICVTKYETECSTIRRMKKMIEDHPRCQIEHLNKCDENHRCSRVPSMKCRIEKRQVTKVKPETSCRRVPRNFCRKVNCAKEAEKKCYYRVQMVNEILPEEKCNYRPQRVCHELDHKKEAEEAEEYKNKFNSTRPGVENTPNGCTITPVQKCERRQSNPRTVVKKMKKKICSTKAELEKQHKLNKIFRKQP
ncbi:unnamed protein product [Lepeophtheirus salmonis]|uniref:(salmon louse) hypothetical protein n=1 Tax=Lepeophtheirus salmonis TaxID=72036 RepID=A0A7R8D0B8_LEPSM|nr:unnamed protein product [Lepeophtheirus salmonis]CAF2957749.1 unnamed protein product [Lepeophtheirus salmonis]